MVEKSFVKYSFVIKRMLSRVPKEIENLVKENLNVSEELDWHRRKRFYKLDPKLEPSLADMVKYNYFNYLRDTKEKFYIELICLANNERMLNFLLDNSDIQEDINDIHIHVALEYCIVNDNLEVFKILYSRIKDISSLYFAMKYNSINILKYIIFDFTSIRITKAFHENMRFLTPENISSLQTHIRSSGMDSYFGLLPLVEIEDDSLIPHNYDMISKNVDPKILLSKIKEQVYKEYPTDSEYRSIVERRRLFTILKHLALTKNKYFFILFDFLAEKEKETLLHIINLLYRIAADTNDYILIKRILITDHIPKYLHPANDYIERFISRSK